MKDTRLKEYINDDLIYKHVIETYKALLKEGNKNKIMYFKALVIGCIKRNIFEPVSGYVSLDRFLYQDHKNFLGYVNQLYNAKYFDNDFSIIYGYHTKDLIKEIL